MALVAALRQSAFFGGEHEVPSIRPVGRLASSKPPGTEPNPKRAVKVENRDISRPTSRGSGRGGGRHRMAKKLGDVNER